MTQLIDQSGSGLAAFVGICSQIGGRGSPAIKVGDSFGPTAQVMESKGPEAAGPERVPARIRCTTAQGLQGYADPPIQSPNCSWAERGQALRDLGHMEGRSIAFELKWADGHYDRLSALAAELVRSKVDVIVAGGGAAAQAAQQATRTIPIVMVAVNDPLGSGLVSSLAHPGGNVTGTSFMAPDLVGKQFEVLKEMVPKVSRVALLKNPGNPASVSQLREAEAAARALGIRLQILEARGPEDIDRAFAAMTRERVSALVVLTDAIFTNQRRQIAEFATERRLPAVYGNIEFAEAGGLLAFSANLFDLDRRAAIYVDKILKGARPGDLPVEQPTKLELVVNLRAAKAIGLAIPPSLLQRADRVID